MKHVGISVIALGALVGLAACDQARVNPPTEPARPVTSPVIDPSAEMPSSSMAPLMPGTGPISFVGRWTPDPVLCARPVRPPRLIEITPLRFEGEGMGCDIARITQVTGGYQASLSCPASGGVHVERVQMSVTGQTLDLVYVDRRGPEGAPRSVKLLKCTTLSDAATTAPGL